MAGARHAARPGGVEDVHAALHRLREAPWREAVAALFDSALGSVTRSRRSPRREPARDEPAGDLEAALTEPPAPAD